MTVDILVRNGLVVTPGGVISGDLAIEGERIVAVGIENGLPPARRTIDAHGLAPDGRLMLTARGGR
jgi:dihydroorotase-like cyclic amidohydrolase